MLKKKFLSLSFIVPERPQDQQEINMYAVFFSDDEMKI